MAASTVQLSSDIEDLLGALRSAEEVLIPRLARVRGYLLRYPDILDTVREVAGLARERFGPEAELSLEVYRDPECRDEYLTLYVRMHRYGTDMVAEIDALRSEYEEAMADKGGWLLVTTDFQPPR